jgi:hypothetical protein
MHGSRETINGVKVLINYAQICMSILYSHFCAVVGVENAIGLFTGTEITKQNTYSFILNLTLLYVW